MSNIKKETTQKANIFEQGTNLLKSYRSDTPSFIDTIKDYLVKLYKWTETHNTFTCLILITICYIIVSMIIIFAQPFTTLKDFPLASNISLSSIGVLLLLTTFYFYINKYSKQFDEKIYLNNSDYFKKAMKTLGSFTIALLAIWLGVFLFDKLTNYSNISFIITILVNFFIISTGIFIFYNWAKKNPRVQNFLKENNIIRIIYNLIIILPCLLFDSISYFYNDIKNTNKLVTIILIIELIIVFSYFIIPIALNYFSTINGKQLLKQPTYLDQEQNIGTYEDFIKNGKEHLKFKERQQYAGILQIDTYAEDEENKDLNYNYALSSWFNLFNTSPNLGEAENTFSTIIDYGGKPKVSFNPSNNTLRVSCKINQKEDRILFETDKIKLQKWNNITLNFVKGTLDIFINGELVNSSKSVVPYMQYDNLVTGQNDGIQGSICNVIYYPNYLDKSSLDFHFNYLKNMKLPIL
jgi:hypothetical protein